MSFSYKKKRVEEERGRKKALFFKYIRIESSIKANFMKSLVGVHYKTKHIFSINEYKK